MKILLTGGAGFIGSHIADLLVSKGLQVVVVDDLSHGKPEQVPRQCAFYQLSITDQKLAEVFSREKPDIVIHHAAQVSVNASVQDALRDMEINIGGTVRLLQASVAHGAKKIIFASTGGALYGEQQYYPADEQHPLYPLSPYGVSKCAAEKYVYCFYKLYKLNFIILRYSNVYGPRQDPLGEAGVVAIFAHRLLRAEQTVINGTGDQTRDFVFVKDVARANLLAIGSQATGEFNICSGRETSINALYALMREIVGSQAVEQHGAALPGEVFRSLLSCKKAGALLGWSPQIRLDDGLKETVRFFSEHAPGLSAGQ